MESRKITIRSKRSNLALKVIPGHFATRNSHINYYLDITTIRARQSEAKAAASILVQDYSRDIVIDTIVCLDGTEIIGAFLAEKLSEQEFYTKNYHHSTYIITPEVDQLGQWFFRENMLPMLKNIWKYFCRQAKSGVFLLVCQSLAIRLRFFVRNY